MDQALRKAFLAGVPILGICLGCQIVLESSEEGDTRCLGLMGGSCRRLVLPDASLKIPHMGWNSLVIRKSHPLFSRFKPGDEAYFVHSFYPQPSSPDNIYAVTGYGVEFPSAIGFKNLFAVQFHPEKSGRSGLAMLEEFARWDGRSC
jgi:glutamine amidotransferase